MLMSTSGEEVESGSGSGSGSGPGWIPLSGSDLDRHVMHRIGTDRLSCLTSIRTPKRCRLRAQPHDGLGVSGCKSTVSCTDDPAEMFVGLACTISQGV